jgi:hypothetical protein
VARHGLVQVRFGVDDLEESKRIFVDVNAAELSNPMGCVSNKPQEVSAEVGMNLGGIDVGKVVGARGANTSKDMVEVFCGKKVVGLVWRTGEVTSLGVEFGVVGGSSTHAVNEVDMEEIRLYQMLYPNINSSRVWQIGCAEQTTIETRGVKFVIGHEASKDAPCWSVSLAVRPQKMPLIGGLCLVQRTSTTKGLNDLLLVGGLCLLQQTSTTKGLNDLPLVGGLCLVQRTLTTKGLNDLPLVGGLCLMQRTLTTRVSMICPSSEDFVSCNGLRPPRVSMICPLSEDFVLCNGL